MIIKGGSRNNGGFFADYLTEEHGLENGNQSAKLKEIRGVTADTVRGFFQEIGAIGSASGTTNYFYHGHINPERDEHLTGAQQRTAIDRLEKNLGLEGLPRLVVEHIKDGRMHLHAIWLRIDPFTLKARPDGFNFAKHERTARELEIEFNLKRQPCSWEHEGPRPDRSPEYWEVQRAKKSGIDPKELKAELTQLWQQSDGGQAFKAAVEEQGYRLARGDRRDFVVVDHVGDIHSLARRLEGVKAADVRAHMADIDRGSLPTAKQAAAEQQARYMNGQTFDREAATAALHNRPSAQAAPEATLESAPQPQQGPPPGMRHEAEAAKPSRPRPKGEHAGMVFDARQESTSAAEFIRALQDKGYILTRATAADLPIRDAENRKAHEKGWGAPRYWGEDSLVAVNRYGGLTPVNTILATFKTLDGFDAIPLPSVSDGRDIMQSASRREFIAKRLDERPLSFVESIIDGAANSRAVFHTLGEQLDRYGITIARASAEDVVQLKAEHDARMEGFVPGMRRQAPAIEEGELMAVTRRGHAMRLNWAKLDLPGIADKLIAEGRTIRTVGEVRAERQQETAQRTEARREQREQRGDDRTARQNQYGPQQPKTGRQAGAGAEKAAGAVASALGSLADTLADLFSFGAGTAHHAHDAEPQQEHGHMADPGYMSVQEMAEMLDNVGRGAVSRSDYAAATPQDLSNVASSNGAADNHKRMQEYEQEHKRERDR